METVDTDEDFPEVVTDATSSRAADAFAALSDDTRFGILLALWDNYEPFADNNTLSFSALRREVGVTDSGRFNYHLEKLSDHFIEATDDGYRLRTAGHKIVQAVVGGVGLEDPSLDANDVDYPCPHCGAPVKLEYEDRKVTLICTECELSTDTDEDSERTIMQSSFDLAGVADRTPGEVLLTNGQQTVYKNGMRLSGICPECSGTVDSWFEICENHEPSSDQYCPHCESSAKIRVRFVCTDCKSSMQGPAYVAATSHPTGYAFGINHGYPTPVEAGDVQIDQYIQAEELFEFDQGIVANEPLRVEATLSHEGGDEMRFVFNESVEIVEIHRPE
jgi:hypothetical protein